MTSNLAFPIFSCPVLTFPHSQSDPWRSGSGASLSQLRETILIGLISCWRWRDVTGPSDVTDSSLADVARLRMRRGLIRELFRRNINSSLRKLYINSSDQSASSWLLRHSFGAVALIASTNYRGYGRGRQPGTLTYLCGKCVDFQLI